jgi:hypothetical protein
MGFDRSTPDSCSCHNTGGKSGTEGIAGTVLKVKLSLQWATVVAGGGGAGEGLLRLCKAKTTSIFMVQVQRVPLFQVGFCLSASTSLCSSKRAAFKKTFNKLDGTVGFHSLF